MQPRVQQKNKARDAAAHKPKNTHYDSSQVKIGKKRPQLTRMQENVEALEVNQDCDQVTHTLKKTWKIRKPT